MLDFGFSEIVLTSAIALIVLGPEKLPKVARQVGNWMGRARAMARQLTDQLEREVNAEDLLKQTRKSTSAVHTGAAQTNVMTPGVSSAPVSFDTSSYTPSALPAATTPLDTAPTPPAYSPQTTSPPHGADWHPSPPEHQTSDG